MEIRTLRYFLAVAREENMTRAAEQLHVTQPTLSKALKSLEDELDKKLFTRHSFSIPKLQYHITSGDTEQVAEKLQKGLLDFVVLAEEPDRNKYEFIALPEADCWGVIFPADDPLAERESFRPSDLRGLPMFCSEGLASGNKELGWTRF